MMRNCRLKYATIAREFSILTRVFSYLPQDLSLCAYLRHFTYIYIQEETFTFSQPSLLADYPFRKAEPLFLFFQVSKDESNRRAVVLSLSIFISPSYKLTYAVYRTRFHQHADICLTVISRASCVQNAISLCIMQTCICVCVILITIFISV